jgi:hypothetical protein
MKAMTQNDDGQICWTKADMVTATVDWWNADGIDETDCTVVRSTDGNGKPCLIVLHVPTGRTSDEAGDAGRWRLDGTAL